MTQEIIEKPMSAECTMKQYEAIPDADFVENREYQLTDYPDNGANAEQMAYALTCQRLFLAGTVVTFSGTTDDNYTNGHLYQIQVDGSGTKSWKDITPVSEQSIPIITGTQENPILFSNMTTGGIYVLKGYLKLTDNTTQNLDRPLLCQKIWDSKIVIWNAHRLITDETLAYLPGTMVILNITGDVYTSTTDLSTIGEFNGSIPNNVGKFVDFYAPTTSGTVGQILQSNGSGKEPTWIDNSAPFILDITDLTTKISDANLIQLDENKVAYIRYTQIDSEQNQTAYLYKKDNTYREGNTIADGDYMTFSLDWHSSDSISLVSNYLKVYITEPFYQDWENPIEKGSIVQVTQEALLTPSGTPTNGQLPMVQDNKLTWANTSTIPTKQQTYFVTEKPTITGTPYVEHDLAVVNNQTVYALEKVNNVLTWVKKYITAPFDYVKFETLTNGEGSKEDKIVITDPDASFNIVYEGENSTANIAISKGFTEMAVVDSLGSSRVSLSGNSVNLITQGTDETNKMQMVIAPEDATLNNKSIEQRYLDLTGDSGTLDTDQYKLVTTYDDLIIRIAGISYRQVGKPQNGTGNYIFTNTYYAQPNGTEEFVAYIVTIKTDKTWTSTIKNFLQIGQQTYAPFVEITPSTATNGNLTDDDYTNLTEHNDVYIILNNEYYRKSDNQHTTGIISYTHTGWNGTQTQDKSINITVATKAWSLVVGTPDTTPTKDSTNTVTSGGVYTALDKLAQSYEQTEADNAVIIRNGNIVKQMATFTVTGNTEKIWSFPYSYDTGKKPIVWVNSVAEGNSSSNGAAVISWSETSMTVRSCGVDSEITFYAEGWITK